jgi:hypothetical protein
MAAFKEGGGTVPRGYAQLRGEHQGDLTDITSSQVQGFRLTQHWFEYFIQ